jgi:alanine racemase
MGNAIYYEMFETLFGKEDRQLELREDFRYDITVAEFSEQEIFVRGYHSDSLRLTTHIEYKKILRHHEFMIGCAFSDEQLAALFADSRCEYRWVMNRGDEPVVNRDFRVARVSVDDEDVPIIRSESTERGYEVWCGAEHLRKKLNLQVKVTIEIFTKKSKSNNIYSVYLIYPTRGLDISFNYEKARFRHVREVSFFAGKHPYPEVRRVRGKSITLKVSNEEWIFPTSGVTFVWDL